MRLMTVFLSLALTHGGGLMAAERPSFAVERRVSDLEIRQYQPYVVAQTEVEGPLESAGNEGFRRLAGYIFGGNGTGQKIAMTAPVAMAPTPEETRLSPKGSGFVVQFMMPSGFTLASLPPPKDGRVTFAEVPARRMAALAYRGNWSAARYQAHLEKLCTALAKEGFKAVGTPVWARYDPPFMPTFMRTNEILVEVQAP